MRVLLGLALVGLTAATACGGQRAGAGGRGLTYYESYDPRSLDPALSTDVPTGEMVTLAFDGLTQFDADGRLLPATRRRARWARDRGASWHGSTTTTCYSREIRAIGAARRPATRSRCGSSRSRSPARRSSRPVG